LCETIQLAAIIQSWPKYQHMRVGRVVYLQSAISPKYAMAFLCLTRT